MAEAAALHAVLVARGREVVVADPPVERLVAITASRESSLLILKGGLSGQELRATAEAVDAQPHLATLVIGPLRPSSEVLVALASGVTGYLAAGTRPEVIADAVDAALAGPIVLARGVSLPVVAGSDRGGRGVSVEWVDGRTVELTHREWEVLVLVRQERSTAEIAERLVVSRPTVRSHLAALVRKLGARDRAVLARPASPEGPEG